MQKISAHTAPGREDRPNEDWLFVSANPGLAIVLDGLTARVDTGCSHGVTWYVAHLGAALASFAQDDDLSLRQVLRMAISRVSEQHATCDLKNPSTPASAVGILRFTSKGAIDYLVLGDVMLMVETDDGVQLAQDNRISATAQRERMEANRHLIGTPEKDEALLSMKRAENQWRNKPGGYWIASTDPDASDQAESGFIEVAVLKRAAILSDGAARIVDLFHVVNWLELLDRFQKLGPAVVINQVREIEMSDGQGRSWPRNKCSDDATAVYLEA